MSMASMALDRVRDYHAALQAKSLEEDQKFILSLGNELQEARRAHITNEKILEIEELLAALFTKTKYKPNATRPVLNAIAKARSYAYDLAYQVDNEKSKNNRFFDKVYILGTKLENLGPLLVSISLPIINALDPPNFLG